MAKNRQKIKGEMWLDKKQRKVQGFIEFKNQVILMRLVIEA